ncbi:MAG: TRAP transporter substrate-binding protein [Methylocystaceae bacterium]|nr:TRAP transporter substrate-binding protein [Methylocystaceae bacterium]
MKKLMTTLKAAIVLSIVAIAPVKAETVLTLSSWLPPSHPVVKDMIVPWTEQVKEATEGRVRVQILAKGLGHPKVHFDVARNGLADITYSVHGYTPGRFLLTKVAEFPLSGNSSETLSTAYWKVYQKYFMKADEHKGTQLLGLMTHGPGHIFTLDKEVTSLEDLKGLKIRIGGGLVNDVAMDMGVSPLLKPARESYELLSHGVADGTFLPTESVVAFKVDNLLKHATLVPNGLYNISFFLVMNEGTFKRLSKADQDAIMKVSGLNFAKIAGKAWDAADAAAMAKMKEQGNKIIEAPAELVEKISAISSNLEAAWIKEASSKGVDAKAALAELRKLTSAQ